MAAIREELVLVDRFSSAFSQYLNYLSRASGAGTAAAASQTQFQAAAQAASGSLDQMAGAGTEAAQAVERTSDSLQQSSRTASQAASQQERVNRSFQRGQSSAAGLERRLLSLAKAYLGVRSAQAFIRLSDTLVETTARLDRMNDGLQTTAELNRMIYEAAQRSRGAYRETADLVSKLGTMAGEAFSSNAELVAFAEQINKQMALAGTNPQGAQAAMLQLTQAMSSGVLRGEELNSILEQAPTIAQSIAKYLGVSVGQMREMASQGQITAQVVKAAMFAAAEETNAAFSDIPLTFGQAWTMAGNAAVMAFQPALEKLNGLLNSALGKGAVNGLISGFELLGKVAEGAVGLMASGAQWVADNWDVVSAVLTIVAAYFAVAAGASIAAAAASAAAWAAAHWPLLLIVGSIALIIYMARQMGATWEEIAGVVGGAFGLMYAFAMNNFIVPAQNGFARFANFLGNLFNDPVAAVKILFLDMAETVLGYLSNVVHGIENLINKIPGLSVNLTSGIDSVYSWVQNASQSVKDASGWKEYVKKWDFVDYANAWESGSAKGRSVGSALDNFQIKDVLGGLSNTGIDPAAFSAAVDAAGIPGALSAIGADVGAIKRSVALSEEDMRLLVDMAERRYVNNINLTAQTPIINVTGQNTGDTELDRQRLADALQRIILEQSASHTDGAYS